MSDTRPPTEPPSPWAPQTHMYTAGPLDTPGQGWACLFLLQGSEGGQPLLLLDGSQQSVGRNSTHDLHLEDFATSRDHLIIDRSIEGWRIRDCGSTNHTFVNGTIVDSWALLRDGDRIRVGSTELQFYSENSPHQAVIRHLLTDPATGLLNRRLIESEIGRVQRQRKHRRLALFDIDNYQGLEHRVGLVSGAQILRSFGAELLRQSRSQFGTDLVGMVGQDTFVVILPSLDWAGTGRRIEAMRQEIRATVSKAHQLEGQLRVSAALTDVLVHEDGYTHPDETVRRGKDKLRQAKFMGGDRASVSRVQPIWNRRDEDRWRAAARQMATLAVGMPTQARDATTPWAQDAIRRELALKLDLLPAGTRVAIAWLVDSGLWLVAASCNENDMRNMNEQLQRLRLITTTRSAGDGLHWVDARVAELVGRSGTGTETYNHLLVSALSRLQTEEPHERDRLAPVYFEKFLRLLGNVLLAITACKYQQNERFEPPPELLLRLSNVAKMKHLGAGQWIHLIDVLWRPIESDLPDSLRHKLGGNMLGALRHATTEIRNRQVHEGHAPHTDEMITHLRELMASMPASEWEFVDVVDVHRARRGQPTLEVRSLSGMSAPAVTTRPDTCGNISEGLWLRRGEKWWPLSPLLDYRKCDGCQQWDLFAARGIPIDTTKPVHRQAFLHPGSHTVQLVRSNSFEIWDMAQAIAATVSTPDWEDEPTGLHQITWPGEPPPDLS